MITLSGVKKNEMFAYLLVVAFLVYRYRLKVSVFFTYWVPTSTG
jgi:hypothetical protein